VAPGSLDSALIVHRSDCSSCVPARRAHHADHRRRRAARESSGGTAGVFPGVPGRSSPPGTAAPNRLRGVAVVTSGEVPWLGQKGLFVAHDSVLDTAGPGAELHPYAGLHLVVLRFSFAAGRRSRGIREGGSPRGREGRAGRSRSSRTTVEPTRVETRELARPASALPRIVHAFQVQSQGVFLRSPALRRVLDELVPTVVHPNELADGALTSGGLGGHGAKMHTWMHRTTRWSTALYAGHGTRWDFAGIILHRGQLLPVRGQAARRSPHRGDREPAWSEWRDLHAWRRGQQHHRGDARDPGVRTPRHQDGAHVVGARGSGWIGLPAAVRRRGSGRDREHRQPRRAARPTGDGARGG